MPAVFSPWNFQELVDEFVVMWELYNSGEKVSAEIVKNYRNL